MDETMRGLSMVGHYAINTVIVVAFSAALIVAGCGEPYYDYELTTDGPVRTLYGKWRDGRHGSGPSGYERVCTWGQQGGITQVLPSGFKYLDAAEIVLLCQEHGLKIPAALAASYQRQTGRSAKELPGWSEGWLGATGPVEK